MKAALFAALALAGCGSGGGGGDKEEAHLATLVVRNVDDLNEITTLWYKPCKSYWNEFLHSTTYYRSQESDWIPVELPWWEPRPGEPRPIPAGPTLWPGWEVIVGEVPEGGYEFLWCNKGSWGNGCPGCDDLCPDGFDRSPRLGNGCVEVLVVHDGETVVEIKP